MEVSTRDLSTALLQVFFFLMPEPREEVLASAELAATAEEGEKTCPTEEEGAGPKSEGDVKKDQVQSCSEEVQKSAKDGPGNGQERNYYSGPRFASEA